VEQEPGEEVVSELESPLVLEASTLPNSNNSVTPLRPSKSAISFSRTPPIYNLSSSNWPRQISAVDRTVDESS
jgi:hypothetical protein